MNTLCLGTEGIVVYTGELWDHNKHVTIEINIVGCGMFYALPLEVYDQHLLPLLDCERHQQLEGPSVNESALTHPYPTLCWN